MHIVMPSELISITYTINGIAIPHAMQQFNNITMSIGTVSYVEHTVINALDLLLCALPATL